MLSDNVNQQMSKNTVITNRTEKLDDRIKTSLAKTMLSKMKLVEEDFLRRYPRDGTGSRSGRKNQQNMPRWMQKLHLSEILKQKGEYKFLQDN